MASYEATEVFVPTGVPTHTYVERPDDLERQFRDAIKTPGLIVSLSGPSKSGKTVLVNKILPRDTLISVSGGAIESPAQLWERVLNWMNAPSEIESTKKTDHTGEISAEAAGQMGLPLIAKVKVGGEVRASASSGSESTVRRARGGIDQVVKEIASSDFTIFIDDFHYMKRDVQQDVARQIKEAAEKGVRICTASVPHRADDVVRGNPELRGRVQAIDFAYWQNADIAKIASQGFRAMGMRLAPATVNELTEQAFGSPQLMQAMCLQSCRELGVYRTISSAGSFEISRDAKDRILEYTSTVTDFSSLLEALHAGPKQRGQERNHFPLKDGTNGDVYRCVLYALRMDPPALAFPYDDIYRRTREVCVGDAPFGSSVTQALEQISAMAESLQPGSRVIEWSDNLLDIVDPYFLFYLRHSRKFEQLGIKQPAAPRG